MLPLMTCGDIFRIIIALFIPPLGVFTEVGLTQPFWINLIIYLFAVGGLGFPVLFGMWPAAVIHALFVILTRKLIVSQQPGSEQISVSAESPA